MHNFVNLVLKDGLCSRPFVPDKHYILDWLGAGASLIGSMLGFQSQSDTNSKQVALAQQQMAQQKEENQLNRDWSEKMWNAQNQYNTPSAMMARYQEAGLNPYLVGSESGVGSAGSPSSPSMVGQGPVPSLTAPMLDLASPIQLALQAKSVDANVANQQSETARNIIASLVSAYKDLGREGFSKVANKIAPFLSQIDPNDSWVSKELRSRIYNLDMDSLNKELQYSLGKKYSAEQIQTSIQEANYRISEIVGRLNSMRVSNQALIDKTAAEVVRATADAFKLSQEGKYYIANASTVNALREFIVKSAEYNSFEDLFGAASAGQAFLLNQPKFNYWTSEEGKKASYGAESITGEQRSSQLIRALDKVLGEYIKVVNTSSTSQNVGAYVGFHN